MKHRLLAGSIVPLLAVAMTASAVANNLQDFYKAKQRAITPEAFYRAEERLARIAPGMTEGKLFELLGTQVLARGHRDRPVDLLIEGYLSRASELVNAQERDSRLHHLRFGFVEAGVEIARYEVLLENRRVRSVTPIAERDLPPPDVDIGHSKGKFMAAKKKSTSPVAFSRAERRLRSVEVDMSELAFLDAMQMAVLTSKGHPVDSFIEGYLPDASAAANPESQPPGERHLVFGYVDGKREHPRWLVSLRGGQVASVERADPATW